MTCLRLCFVHALLALFSIHTILVTASQAQDSSGSFQEAGVTRMMQQNRYSSCSYISRKEYVKRWVSREKRNIAHVANTNEVQFKNIRSEICEGQKNKMSHHRASLLNFRSFVNQNVTPQSKFAAFPMFC